MTKQLDAAEVLDDQSSSPCSSSNIARTDGRGKEFWLAAYIFLFNFFIFRRDVTDLWLSVSSPAFQRSVTDREAFPSYNNQCMLS